MTKQISWGKDRGREARGWDGKLGGVAEVSWRFRFGGTGMKGDSLGREAGGSDGRSGGRKFSVNRFSIQERVFAFSRVEWKMLFGNFLCLLRHGEQGWVKIPKYF